tara:strand:- start:953 stop:1426 length:474 start_codon:yes stop_codon:yes gene_type:complete
MTKLQTLNSFKSLAYEDFKVGQKLELGTHQLGRDEIIEFAKEWDPMPFHIDEKAGEESPHGGLIASGSHLIAIRIKLIQSDGINPYVIAAMGWDEVRFLRPGRPDDLLTLISECLEKRSSKSKPDRGIVRSSYELINQNSETTMSMTDTLLVRKRGN